MSKALAAALGLEWRPDMDVSVSPVRPEEKAKIGPGARPGKLNYMFGRTHTPEAVAKIKAAPHPGTRYWTGKKNPDQSKRMRENNPMRRQNA